MVAVPEGLQARMATAPMLRLDTKIVDGAVTLEDSMPTPLTTTTPSRVTYVASALDLSTLQ